MGKNAVAVSLNQLGLMVLLSLSHAGPVTPLLTAAEGDSAGKQKLAPKPRAVPSPPHNYALLDVPGYKLQAFTEKRVPDYFRGALVYRRLAKPRPGDIRAGVLEFTVRREGPVFLAASWVQDGNAGGNWMRERLTHSDLYDRGWLELGRCGWDPTHILYHRHCHPGESFRIRTRKLHAPTVFLAAPVDFLQPRMRAQIPVRSVIRLLNRRNLRLLSASKFDELETIAAELRRKKAKFRNGDSRLFAFYNGLADPQTEVEKKIGEADWQQRLNQLQQWAKARPKSITPQIALAMCYDRYGSFARGSGWASSVSEKNMQRYVNRVRKARDILLGAEKTIARDDPVLYSTLIGTGIALGDERRVVDGWLEKSLKLDPLYLPSVYGMTTYLMPRWHGAPGELEKFADKMVEKTKQHCGAMVYAVIVRKISWYTLVDTFDQFAFSWEKTRQGFLDLEKTYPQSRDHLDRFCYLACTVGDAKTAHELFGRIGEDYRIHHWGHQDRYQEWRYVFRPEIWKGDQQRHIWAHRDGLLDLAFSHDGRLIATTGLDKRVRIWEAATGKKLFVTPAGDSWGTCLDFSPRSLILVVGTGGGEVLLWDFANRQAGAIGSHKGRVEKVAFAPDGTRIASIGGDGHLIVWNLKTGAAQCDVPRAHGGRVTGVAFHPDGKRMVTVGGDGRLVLRDAQTAAISSQWKVMKGPATAVACSADGKRVAVGSPRGTVIVWDIAGKRQISQTTPVAQFVRGLSFSRSGDQLAIALGGGRKYRSGAVYVWTGKTDDRPRALQGHKMAVMSVRFSPSAETLATGSMDWSLRLWKSR